MPSEDGPSRSTSCRPRRGQRLTSSRTPLLIAGLVVALLLGAVYAYNGQSNAIADAEAEQTQAEEAVNGRHRLGRRHQEHAQRRGRRCAGVSDGGDRVRPRQ